MCEIQWIKMHGETVKYIIDAFLKLQKASISFIMSVRPSAWKNLVPTEQIFVKIYIGVLFETH